MLLFAADLSDNQPRNGGGFGWGLRQAKGHTTLLVIQGS